MSKSVSLRSVDWRNLFHLLGDCRDLGADSVAWRVRLFEGLCRLLGGTFAVGGETVGLYQGAHRSLQMVDWGMLGQKKRENLYAYNKAEAERGGIHPLQAVVHQQAPFHHVTIQRQDRVPDDVWYRSTVYEFQGDAGLDHTLTSVHVLETQPVDLHHMIMLLRAKGDKAFSNRELLLVDVLHQELSPLIGRQLASAREPSPGDLPPRLRKVLEALLEGDSEKQVALRLGYTRGTVHQYVKAIYSHFRVESRAELMARWIRFDRARPPAGEDHIS